MKITSVKTKLAGILTVLASAIMLALPMLDGDEATKPAWDIHLPVIMAGLGLSITRENKVTSEQAGAKPPAPPGPPDTGRASPETLGIMWFTFAVLLAVGAVMASGCVPSAAGAQARNEVARHERIVRWFEAGAVPFRSGDAVVMVPATGGVALQFFRASLDAWRAQAYYLDAGPRPSHLDQ